MIIKSLSLFVILFAVLLIRTLLFTTRQLKITKTVPEEIDSESAFKRLSESIKLQTVSSQNNLKNKSEAFNNFHDLLEKVYPAIHQKLEKTIINKLSLLYKWPGKNSNLDPIALLAHIDVVPVEPGTEQEWQYKPFSGEIADGFIWGRGALDMKGTLMAIMEAVEKLVTKDFIPERTIYLAFGHDEEIGGDQGAGQIAAFLKNQIVHLSYTLDEGMVILNKELSPCNQHLGVIGIAEKGYVTLKLTAMGEKGHASSPSFNTTIGTLCKAVTRLEKRQMPARLTGAVSSFFLHSASAMTFGKKLLFTNQWLFKPLILFFLKKSETTNALIRTTTAPTMIQSGIKENVLPGKAEVFINFRILPGDTIEKVVEHIKTTINNNTVTVEVTKGLVAESSPVSSTRSNGFQNIQKAIYQVFPDTLVAPGLFFATTDSRHYTKISDNCYRFAPFVYGLEDRARVHGTNERVSKEGYINAIHYYIQFIKNCGGK